MKDPYETLDLPKTATDAQIKATFKKLGAQVPPGSAPR